jgi:hypothetical protein
MHGWQSTIAAFQAEFVGHVVHLSPLKYGVRIGQGIHDFLRRS